MAGLQMLRFVGIFFKDLLLVNGAMHGGMIGISILIYQDEGFSRMYGFRLSAVLE